MCKENLGLYSDNINNLKINKERLENIISYVIKYKGGIFDGFKGQKQYYETLEWITKETTENTMYLLNSEYFKMEDYDEYSLPVIKLIIRITFLIEGFKPGKKLPLNIYTIKGYYGINKSIIIGIELEKSNVVKEVIKTLYLTINNDVDSAAGLAKNTALCVINHNTLKSRSLIKEVVLDNVAEATETLVSGITSAAKAAASNGASLIDDAPKFALKATKATKSISSSIRNTKSDIQISRVNNKIDLVILVFNLANFTSKCVNNYKILYSKNNIQSEKLYGYDNSSYGFVIKNNIDVSEQN